MAARKIQYETTEYTSLKLQKVCRKEFTPRPIIILLLTLLPPLCRRLLQLRLIFIIIKGRDTKILSAFHYSSRIISIAFVMDTAVFVKRVIKAMTVRCK